VQFDAKMNYRESSNLPLEQDSSALKPIYLTKKPNQPIQLYEGSLEITQKGIVKRGIGNVCVGWFPSPDINFEFSTDDEWLYEFDNSEASLKLLELTTPVTVKIYILTVSECFISGCLRSRESLLLQSEQDLSYLMFHLINFQDFRGTSISVATSEVRRFWCGRVVLEAGGWIVTIDTLESLRDIMKSLKDQGGYAITHVGKFERSDKGAFTAEKAEDILTALYHFLSFSSGGLRTLPILPVGYDVNGENVWERWLSNYIATPWQSVYSWFPDPDGQSLNKAFPGFLRRWQSNIWNEPIRLAIQWYLDSKAKARSVQGSIILIQTVLELLAWVFLVEEAGVSRKDLEDKHNKNYNSTSKKINRLFEALSVPQEIPHSLDELIKFNSTLKESNKNGSYTLSELRNNIIHAAPENREKFRNTSFETMIEALELGLWYVELVLLRLFDYQGHYFNRVLKSPLSREGLFHDNIVAVPWS
jgi:hypothetical protein